MGTVYQPYITFLVGLIVGIFSIGAALAVFGKWMLKAIVKEVVGEMSGNWVPTAVGNEHAHRLDRLEKQFDSALSVIVQRLST
jgi:hypothetical protein